MFLALDAAMAYKMIKIPSIPAVFAHILKMEELLLTSSYSILLLVAPVLFAISVVIPLWRRDRGILPPSPPGDVLLGHALRVPEKYQWKTFAQWGKVYGNEFTFKEMQSGQVTGFQVICCTYIASEGQ